MSGADWMVAVMGAAVAGGTYAAARLAWHRLRKPRPVTLTLDEILEADKKLRMLGGLPLEGAPAQKRERPAAKAADPPSSGET